MPSILEKFALGNIDPNPSAFDRDSAYGKAVKALADSEQKLLAALDSDAKALYEPYFEAQMKVESLQNVERFVSGYKLGALMMLEVMTGE